MNLFETIELSWQITDFFIAKDDRAKVDEREKCEIEIGRMGP